MKRTAILVASTILLTATPATAQEVAATAAVPVPVFDRAWGRASTVQEGAARGAADMIRSAGVANLLNSKAAQGYEQARSMNLDNRAKYAEVYFAKRRMNQEFRDAQKEPPPTQEQLFRRSEMAKPKRLSPGEFDPVSGRITWPLLLKSKAFDDDRAAMENVFAEMATTERLSFDQYQQIREVGARMQKQLNAMIREVSAKDHMKATSFLTSLLYEARLVAG
jgi:hypothetical protein